MGFSCLHYFDKLEAMGPPPPQFTGPSQHRDELSIPTRGSKCFADATGSMVKCFGFRVSLRARTRNVHR